MLTISATCAIVVARKVFCNLLPANDPAVLIRGCRKLEFVRKAPGQLSPNTVEGVCFGRETPYFFDTAESATVSLTNLKGPVKLR